MRRRILAGLGGFVLAFAATALVAQETPPATAPEPERVSLHFQFTTVTQTHPSFDAPYSGRNSLSPDAEHETTVTSTLFAGARLWSGAELHVDGELSGGSGLSHAVGVAGFPNGESFRVGDAQPRVYLARAFLRQVIAAGEEREAVPADQDQLAGTRPVRRWTLTIGKVGISDLFDDNDYSHDPRTQFLNWAGWTSGAFDYAADTRGYTWLAAVEYDAKDWAVRFAVAAEPKEANGLQIEHDLGASNSLVLEYDHGFRLGGDDGLARFVVFRNRAPMGSYEESLALAGPAPPDITATRQPGREKWGGVVNLQLALTPRAGLFFRGSYNDGKNESWAYAEIDRSLLFGGLVKAPLSGRPDDEAGASAIVNALSGPHRDYLASGGYGFMIGDGRLTYDYEEIAELYYAATLNPLLKGARLTANYQFVLHPAYNRDRGPVHLLGLRFHFEI